MRVFFFLILLVAVPWEGFSTLIGNPAQPGLQKDGIFFEIPQWWSLRAAYFGDYVYSQRFQDEFPIGECSAPDSHLQVWTQAGLFTLNFRNHIDLYGILGGLRLRMDQEVLTSQEFVWGVGGKISFLHLGKFRAGCDVKYLQSKQTPEFFQCENFAYNVMDDFRFLYEELQVALGVSYLTSYFSPYINASYLIAKLKPNLPKIALRLPMINREIDVFTKSVTASHRFGLALGATLIDHKKATLSLEWRAFNQNSIDATCELRF